MPLGIEIEFACILPAVVLVAHKHRHSIVAFATTMQPSMGGRSEQLVLVLHLRARHAAVFTTSTAGTTILSTWALLILALFAIVIAIPTSCTLGATVIAPYAHDSSAIS